MLTFSEFKSGPAKRIAGACASSSAFMDLTNDAIRQLMIRGNWYNTVVPLRGCVYGECVTWPRQVATVLAMNMCGHPMEIRNRWYSFMPWDEFYGRCARDLIHGGHRGNAVLDNDGTTPVFNQIACARPMFLLFYLTSSTDVGRNITVFGVDENGQTIRSLRPDGTYQNGIRIAMALPYASTPFRLQRVDRILKDKFNGPVRVFQWDGSSMWGSQPQLVDMAYYEASETVPEYVHGKLCGLRMNPACSSGNVQISALVKLQFTPVQHDDDLVLIDCPDAVRDMMFSIREKESGNVAQATELELSAFRELNYQLRDRFPIEQFNASFRPFGSAELERQGIGQII